jgi:hypothetical protein
VARKRKRLSLEETWAKLEAEGEEMPRDGAGQPYVPANMPRYDAKPIGFEIYKSGYEDADFSYLTLPGTVFGRSDLTNCDFRGTDLSRSHMCWNDFTGCDFRGADLTGCDLRRSVFRDCKFDSAILAGADLRGSEFEGCTFKGADMTGTLCEKYMEWDADELLTKKQRASMVFHEDEGDEPDGG